MNPSGIGKPIESRQFLRANGQNKADNAPGHALTAQFLPSTSLRREAKPRLMKQHAYGFFCDDRNCHPTAARYAWQINPFDGPNGTRIDNGSGLPIPPTAGTAAPASRKTRAEPFAA